MQCGQLRELVIASNRFTSLPSVVYQLTTLEVLIASNNKITDLDAKQMIGLVSLAVLDLANNDISALPPELGKMNLRSLKVEGNRFKVPGAHILAKGTSELMKWLRSRLPNDKNLD